MMPTRKQTPWPAEWYVGPIGEQWYYTRAEVKAAEQRAGKTLSEPEDTVSTPDLRPVRTCRDCGVTFHSERKATNQRCPSCKSRHVHQQTKTGKGRAA